MSTNLDLVAISCECSFIARYPGAPHSLESRSINPDRTRPGVDREPCVPGSSPYPGYDFAVDVPALAPTPAHTFTTMCALRACGS